LAGLGIGIGVLALVANPVVVYAFSAGLFFVGWDKDPDPMRGAYCVGIVLFLLALPLMAGLVTAGVLRTRGWRIALAASVLISLWLTRGSY